MRHAEEVTFGGSGLDRAAQFRGQPDALKQMLTTGKILPLWRGKTLVDVENDFRAVRLDADHALIVHGDGNFVFLGLDDGVATFACDVSGWEPKDQEDVPDGFLDPSVQHYPGLPPAQQFHELRAIMAQISPRDAELLATGKSVLGWHQSHQFCSKCGAQSLPDQAGWERDCPECHGKHFPRTDPVVIMLVTDGNNLLLGRSPGWPEGMYSTLAGFIEPGETVEAAVRREVFEEAGVTVGEVKYLASQPWAFPSSLMIGCHGVATSNDITIDPVEIEEAFWISREDLALAFAGNHPKVKAARQGAIARFLMENWLADRLD